jgi:uncharacterized small protein (DUF1192 family)
MRASLILVVIVSVASVTCPVASAGNGSSCGREETTCGCAHPHACCHRHHCHRAGRERAEVSRFESRMAAIPTGPVVESVAVYRAMPGIVFAPVGGLMTESAFLRRESAPQKETSCEASSDRLGNLENSVRTINERMGLLEESIRTQNELLLKLKTKLLAE